MLNLDQIKKHLEAPQPGFLYEPRAFWDTSTTFFADPLRSLRPVELDSENFYNGSKYPIVLTDIVFEPALGLLLDSMAMRGLLDGVITIASAGNQPVTRGSIPLRSLVGPGAFEPPSPYAAAPSLSGGFTPQTGVWGPVLGPIWNLSQWSFTHPLVLPKDGAITLSLGNRLDTDTAPGVPPVRLSVTFNEGGDGGSDFYKGNARDFTLPNQDVSANSGPWTVPQSGGKAPGATPVWAPNGTLTATAYRRQNVTQAGSTAVRGFSVAVNQREWNEYQAGAPSAAVSAYSSRASATPVKAKTAGCGTQESWWRDGAPLSLVSPTRTPALTGKLPVPITLQPGDGLTIVIKFGANGDILTEPPPGNTYLGHSVGVSFCGFAAIEA